MGGDFFPGLGGISVQKNAGFQEPYIFQVRKFQFVSFLQSAAGLELNLTINDRFGIMQQSTCELLDQNLSVISILIPFQQKASCFALCSAFHRSKRGAKTGKRVVGKTANFWPALPPPPNPKKSFRWPKHAPKPKKERLAVSTLRTYTVVFPRIPHFFVPLPSYSGHEFICISGLWLQSKTHEVVWFQPHH